ncbi:MAG: hypothetical protein QOH04_1854, partial [Sphingomonadales bacterium]|nr:hypothetical protein [Sphingomonadales bacterium]
MTNGLSRREMVLFGTAGCALSGCSGPEARQPKAAAGQQHGKALEEGRGVGAPWGKDAHQGPGSKYPSFAPEYVALLHLGFEKQWKIRINHACMHFKASP